MLTLKMFYMYVLISAMTVSTVLAGVTNTQPREVTIEGKESQSKLEKSLTFVEHDDRESNLRYVMAIEKSSFWTEIKKRSLTVSSEPHTDSIINKSPDNLSDEELTQLKRLCQDGLKCVAVDHLLILKQVMQPTDDGKNSIRTAITIITKVLTQYTNENHEDTYQYVEVTDKDDTEKVYSSVTTIVADNEKLCQIDSNTYTRSDITSYGIIKTDAYLSSYENANESSNNSSVNNSNKTSGGSPGGSSGSSLNGNSDENTEQEGPLTIVNNGNLNFGTVNTFNVNEGTMNSATINLDPPKNADGSYKVPKKISINVDSNHNTPELDNTSTSQNDDQNTSSTSQDKGTLGDGNESLNYVNIGGYGIGIEEPSSTGTSDSDTKTVNNPNQGNSSPKTVMPADSRLTQVNPSGTAKAKNPTDINGGAIYPNVTSNNFNGDSSSNADKSEASKNTTDGSTDTTGSKNNALNAEKSKDNHLNFNNAKNATQGENNQKAGIVSAGHHNIGKLNKGYVEDGSLNNGMMKLMEFNKGVNNKGVISNGRAKGGIISVGNVNNGKTNYNTINERINNGEIKKVNNYDVLKFADDLSDMYTSILNDLARQ